MLLTYMRYMQGFRKLITKRHVLQAVVIGMRWGSCRFSIIYDSIFYNENLLKLVLCSHTRAKRPPPDHYAHSQGAPAPLHVFLLSQQVPPKKFHMSVRYAAIYLYIDEYCILTGQRCH